MKNDNKITEEKFEQKVEEVVDRKLRKMSREEMSIEQRIEKRVSAIAEKRGDDAGGLLSRLKGKVSRRDLMKAGGLAAGGVALSSFASSASWSIFQPSSKGDSEIMPQGVQAALTNKKALADDGNLYDTVQGAENAASNWVFLPPKTFGESVTIDTSGLTLAGSGYNTVIDGGTTGSAIIIDADNVTIRDLSVKTTGGSGNSYRGIEAGSAWNAASETSGHLISRVTVQDSDDHAIGLNPSGTSASNSIVKNCRIESADLDALYTHEATGVVFAGCIVTGGRTGIQWGSSNSHDIIASGNVIVGTSGDGMNADGADDIIIGNRIHNAGTHGIDVTETDSIVANNRISGSSNSDINKNGTNVTYDANLTGAAN